MGLAQRPFALLEWSALRADCEPRWRLATCGPWERSWFLSPETVARASAGALAHLPVARVKNLVRAMEEMKEAGYWLVGLDERAEQRHTEVDLKVPVGIVLGGEGKGLHALTRERCDFLVSIPTTGPVRALNVSVAAGVVLFEVVRQRGQPPLLTTTTTDKS